MGRVYAMNPDASKGELPPPFGTPTQTYLVMLPALPLIATL